jgi:thiamine-monophosphate kinase
MDREEQLIKRIARAIPSRPGRGEGDVELRLGIGDDAAIIAANGRSNWILSCDAFLESIHFLADAYPADSVGYKSLVRAASDLAAMGATPRLFLLTLALPVGKTGAWLDEFLRGMGRAARMLGMRIAGGDTSKNPTVAINITVLGEISPGRAVTRSGATPGDIIYVSGKLGGAQLGLELMQKGVGGKARFAELVRPHLYPRIRVRLGGWIAERGIASAMMDISDGLSTDLGRLAGASGVGARLWADRVPQLAALPVGLLRRLRGWNPDLLQLALHGGEDYELLFTVSPRKVKRLRGAPESGELAAIGEITREKRIVIVGADERERRLVARGWDPFRKA